MQTALQQAAGIPEPPLCLLGGRWSIGLISNFVLTFTGKPCHNLVENYKNTFLKFFPAGIFQLIPKDGFKKLVVHDVPCMHHPNSTLPTGLELLWEMNNNMHL